MPIVDVTLARSDDAGVRAELARRLPHEVSLAVACADEPYDGELRPGDVILRFHDAGSLDEIGLDVLVEVRSKWFEDRAADRQRRVDDIRTAVGRCVPAGWTVGVYLSLPVAAWAQTGD